VCRRPPQRLPRRGGGAPPAAPPPAPPPPPPPPKQQHLVSSVALVTHGGVLRALLGHWLQLPAGEWCALQFGFGSITRVDVGDGKATLRYLNR